MNKIRGQQEINIFEFWLFVDIFQFKKLIYDIKQQKIIKKNQ